MDWVMSKMMALLATLVVALLAGASRHDPCPSKSAYCSAGKVRTWTGDIAEGARDLR